MVNYLSSVKKRTKPPLGQKNDDTLFPAISRQASKTARQTSPNLSSLLHTTQQPQPPTLSVKTPQCRSKYRFSRHAGYTLVRPEAPCVHLCRFLAPLSRL